MSDANDSGNSAATGLVNSQVVEAIEQVQRLLGHARRPFAATAASQTIAHALGVALQNAVANQQHCHMLRNALTTAAAKALLDGRADAAEAVLKLAASPLVNPSLDIELAQLRAAWADMPAQLDIPADGAAASAG